jgi:hypothetical protein
LEKAAAMPVSHALRRSSISMQRRESFSVAASKSAYAKQ